MTTATVLARHDPRPGPELGDQQPPRCDPRRQDEHKCQSAPVTGSGRSTTPVGVRPAIQMTSGPIATDVDRPTLGALREAMTCGLRTVAAWDRTEPLANPARA
jgi:hypothetical protein